MKKKKMTLPRTQWHIKPVTKIKQSGKLYDRKKDKLRKGESE